MDRGRVLKDGKRIFGDNKTWIGFFGMIVFAAFSQIIWGLLCKTGLGKWNYIYEYHENTIIFNFFIGTLFGLAYMLCELPNSFVKRRLNIPDGKTVTGVIGKCFFIIDQTDSLFGVGLVLAFLYPMPVWQYFLYILLGAFTHLSVNFILYKVKIRRNL